jgi:hypothetical protein
MCSGILPHGWLGQMIPGFAMHTQEGQVTMNCWRDANRAIASTPTKPDLAA